MDNPNQPNNIDPLDQSLHSDDQSIEFHLREALFQLETALNKSITRVLENDHEKKQIGSLWEHFLGEFFGRVREKGKQSKLNLLAWITFPRIRS